MRGDVVFSLLNAYTFTIMLLQVHTCSILSYAYFRNAFTTDGAYIHIHTCIFTRTHSRAVRRNEVGIRSLQLLSVVTRWCSLKCQFLFSLSSLFCPFSSFSLTISSLSGFLLYWIMNLKSNCSREKFRF